jgi:phenylalanyl-tRNA synthetase beta chain
MDVKKLSDRLTMSGLEVAAIHPVAPVLDHILVGEIVSVMPHPSAERLFLCRVDIGKKKILDIVCGAANATAGMKIPVALEGAVLATGVKIKRAEIRGITSYGMLCSVVELGLGESGGELMNLGKEAVVGEPLTDFLGIDDVVLEIDLTPNRGDCLSVSGIAREISALTVAKVKSPPNKPVSPKHRQKIPVMLHAPKDCPHYVGRIISDINPKAVTPMWMSERLRRSDIRIIHPVVDVTNYVMLEFGQPMHAFDFEKINGAIRIRYSQPQERLVLLDGKEIDLIQGSLVIADNQQPLALAGIMGGLFSAVSDSTCNIFLESAWFRPETIATLSRNMTLQTESSQRFERGVDPALQRPAIERATKLLLEIMGGKPGPVIEQSAHRFLPPIRSIKFRLARVERILGAKVSPKNIENILKRLGMKLKKTGSTWTVTPPSYRFDITHEVDLIEEIARVHGFDKLPSSRPRIEMATKPIPEIAISETRLRTVLIDRDYQEVITYSFIDPGNQALIDPGVNPLRVANPISVDMAVMRTTLWPGLLQAIRYNLNRQHTRVRLFEIGRTFFPMRNSVVQNKMLGGAVCGGAQTKQWGVRDRGIDLFDVKADVEALLGLIANPEDFAFNAGHHPALHPGQSAEIGQQGRKIGMLGVLHPGIQLQLELEQPVVLFELDLSLLKRTGNSLIFNEFSKFPSIRRDIAVIVAEKIPAQAVIDCVRKVAGKLLVNLELFDEYRGKGIDSGRKSLAVGLTFQDSSRTLNEDEAERIKAEVIAALGAELGAQARQ